MKKPCRAAFTLIELLVVLAVIGVLAAILFPVFGRARENGRRVSCLNNLKQIGLALQQYSMNNDDILNGDWYGIDTDSGPTSSQPVSVPRARYKWMDAAHPYIRSEAIFVCPSASGQAANPWIFYERLTAESSDYGSYTIMHGYGASQPNRTPPVSHPLVGDLVKLSQAEVPAETVWVTDGDGAFFCRVTGTELTNLVARHLDTAGVLYLDGHVKAARSEVLNRLDPTGTYIPSVTIQND